MSKPACLVCGSIDVVMDGGAFVCRDCGSRYSVEQMRDIVSGALPQNDATPRIANDAARQAEQSADRYFARGNYKDAITECNRALNLDSNSHAALLVRALSLLGRDYQDVSHAVDDYSHCDDISAALQAAYSYGVDTRYFLDMARKAMRSYSLLAIERSKAAARLFAQADAAVSARKPLPQEVYDLRARLKREMNDPSARRGYLFRKIADVINPHDEAALEGLKVISHEESVDGGERYCAHIAYWADRWEERDSLLKEKKRLSDKLSKITHQSWEIRDLIGDLKTTKSKASRQLENEARAISSRAKRELAELGSRPLFPPKRRQFDEEMERLKKQFDEELEASRQKWNRNISQTDELLEQLNEQLDSFDSEHDGYLAEIKAIERELFPDNLEQSTDA